MEGLINIEIKRVYKSFWDLMETNKLIIQK